MSEFQTRAMFPLEQIEEEQRTFIINVYKWMSMGLFLTAGISYIVGTTPNFVNMIVSNSLLMWGLLIAEFVAVAYFATCVKKMSATQAMLVFLGYAALNGLTFSVIFLAYTKASIMGAFGVTAGTFAIMSAYGYLTKKDLTSIGNLCFMGLIGLIIASIVNMFMHNAFLASILNYIGVLVFVGLTAHDTQKIKEMNIIGNAGTDEDVKESINGALILYLDFINLFIYLLRILGDRR